MSKVKFDVVATVGSYKNRDGDEKKVYRTVGKLIEGDKGPFLVLDATFSPAGMPKRDDGSVTLGLYEPKAKDAVKVAGDDDLGAKDRIPF